MFLDAKNGLSLGSLIPPQVLDTRLTGLGPLITFDSRDNLFNPRRGTYAELIALRFAERWTLAGILGAGNIAPERDAFGDAETVFSKVLGMRFLASQKDQVNIGIDYAVGPDDNAIYFRVGEAF